MQRYEACPAATSASTVATASAVCSAWAASATPSKTPAPPSFAPSIPTTPPAPTPAEPSLHNVRRAPSPPSTPIDDCPIDTLIFSGAPASPGASIWTEPMYSPSTCKRSVPVPLRQVDFLYTADEDGKQRRCGFAWRVEVSPRLQSSYLRVKVLQTAGFRDLYDTMLRGGGWEDEEPEEERDRDEDDWEEDEDEWDEDEEEDESEEDEDEWEEDGRDEEKDDDEWEKLAVSLDTLMEADEDYEPMDIDSE